jgi:hypothetical protein
MSKFSDTSIFTVISEFNLNCTWVDIEQHQDFKCSFVGSKNVKSSTWKVCTPLKLKASKDQRIELQDFSTNKLLVIHHTFNYFIFHMLVLLML